MDIDDSDIDEIATPAAELLARLVPRPRDAVGYLIFRWDRLRGGRQDLDACLTLADQIMATLAVYRAVILDEPADPLQDRSDSLDERAAREEISGGS